MLEQPTLYIKDTNLLLVTLKGTLCYFKQGSPKGDKKNIELPIWFKPTFKSATTQVSNNAKNTIDTLENALTTTTSSMTNLASEIKSTADGIDALISSKIFTETSKSDNSLKQISEPLQKISVEIKNQTSTAQGLVKKLHDGLIAVKALNTSNVKIESMPATTVSLDNLVEFLAYSSAAPLKDLLSLYSDAFHVDTVLIQVIELYKAHQDKNGIISCSGTSTISETAKTVRLKGARSPGRLLKNGWLEIRFTPPSAARATTADIFKVKHPPCAQQNVEDVLRIELSEKMPSIFTNKIAAAPFLDFDLTYMHKKNGSFYHPIQAEAIRYVAQQNMAVMVVNETGATIQPPNGMGIGVSREEALVDRDSEHENE